MPGGIPSGSDPSGINPWEFSIVGAMLSGMKDRTEENIRAIKTQELQDNDTLNSYSEKVFAGINPALGIVAGVIDGIVRQIVGTVEDVGEDVMEWANNLLAKLNVYYQHLGSFLASINFLDPDFDPAVAAQEFVNLMLLPLNLLLGPNSPLNANNIFNLIPANLLAFLPASSVGEDSPNLITNPDFEGDEPIESSVFTLDLTTSYSEVGGSAKVVADGSTKDLLSPDLIRVSLGQRLSLSAMAKWNGLTGSGSPIILGITGYTSNGSPIATPNIDTRTTTPGSTDWIQLSGEYTITNPLIASVRLRLSVSSSATAGSVWWDHVDLHKTNKILTKLIADEDGNGLPDVLDDFTSIVNGILSQIPGFATLTQLFDLQNVLGGGFGNTLENIQERLEDFLTPGSNINGSNIIGEIIDEHLPGLQNAINNIASGLFNLPFGNYTQSQAAEALTHTSETLATLAAQVDALSLARGSGVLFGDEFERTSSSWGSDWDVTYTGGAGSLKTDGHNGYFDGSGTNQRKYVARFIPGTTADDYQIWSITLNSAPETAAAQIFPPILGGDPAFNGVAGRMNSTKTDYIEFRCGDGLAKIIRVVGGSETELNSQPFPTPGPGSTLTLQCGAVGSNARYFQGRVNGQKAVEITEVGTASPVDSSHRQGGVTGIAGNWILALRQSKPGSIKQFLGADQ